MGLTKMNKIIKLLLIALVGVILPVFLVYGATNVFSNLDMNDNDIVNVGTINATDWGNVTITESQISDLSHTVDTTCDGGSCNIANTGTLDGYEAAALLDDTTLTEEQVEDFVGGMLVGTETGITVSYQDATGDIDFVVDVGASIDDTDMTAEDFGEFTCSGLEDGCTLDTGTFDDEYVELNEAFGGEVSGTYDAIILSHTALDDQYIELTDNFGGEVSGTYGAIVIGNDALDDQYYDSEADLTALLDDNYEGELNNEAGLYAALSDVTQFYESGDSPSFNDVTVTGNVVAQNNITVQQINFEIDSTNHYIYDNATCMVFMAGTTKFEICE